MCHVTVEGKFTLADTDILEFKRFQKTVTRGDFIIILLFTQNYKQMLFISTLIIIKRCYEQMRFVHWKEMTTHSLV